MIAKKIKLSRKLRVFLITLLLSAFLWFINHLSGEFKVNVDVDVHLTNIPSYYNSQFFPDTCLQLEITGSGFGLIRYYLKDSAVVNLDFNQLTKQEAEDQHIFNAGKNYLIETIQKVLPGNIKISNFDYNQLQYSVTSYPSKNVAIYSDLEYDCAYRYMVLEPIQITPDSVHIEGSSKIINKIDSVFTAPVILKNLNDSVNLKAKLLIEEEDKWMFSTTEVQIIIPVVKVKRLKWIEHFKTDIEGKIIDKNIEMEAWVPENTNSVKIKFRYKIKNDEIILTPQVQSNLKLINYSPRVIPIPQ